MRQQELGCALTFLSIMLVVVYASSAFAASGLIDRFLRAEASRDIALLINIPETHRYAPCTPVTTHCSRTARRPSLHGNALHLRRSIELASPSEPVDGDVWVKVTENAAPSLDLASAMAAPQLTNHPSSSARPRPAAASVQ